MTRPFPPHRPNLDESTRNTMRKLGEIFRTIECAMCLGHGRVHHDGALVVCPLCNGGGAR